MYNIHVSYQFLFRILIDKTSSSKRNAETINGNYMRSQQEIRADVGGGVLRERDALQPRRDESGVFSYGDAKSSRRYAC